MSVVVVGAFPAADQRDPVIAGKTVGELNAGLRRFCFSP
jgi:hypothetical protein